MKVVKMTTRNAKAKGGVIASTGDRMEWMKKGKCKETDLTTIDDIEDDKTRKATAEYYKNELCFKCPVRIECLTYIVVREYRDRVTPSGLWGGTYGIERSRLVRAFRDTDIEIDILISRWIANKAIYDSKYILKVKDAKTKQILKEANANTPHGVRVIQSKLRRKFEQEVEIWSLDTETGKSKLVDPSLPR